MTDTPPATPSAPRKTDHLQGVTLENLLNQLVDQYGWATLSDLVRINCFRSNPSIRSSLTFCAARLGPERRWKRCLLVLKMSWMLKPSVAG